MTETNSKGLLLGEISKVANKNSRLNRVSSMFLDHCLMCLLIVPFLIIAFIFRELLTDNQNSSFNTTLFYISFFIYLNKDFFNAKSPAKRILGYQIIDRKTNKQANELQCFIRNLTICVAWPIEVVIVVINPVRRIGDVLANTKVIKSNQQKISTIITDIKHVKLKPNFFGILIVSLIYFYGLSLIFP